MMKEISSSSSDRKQWVDVIRGICVFLVVVGHLNTNHVLHIVINQIKMPMFYVLAGIFIKPNKKPLTFVKDSAFRLGIPYIIFSFIWLKSPYYLLMHQSNMAIQKFIELINGEAFWFVPSFFLSQILFMLLWKIFREKKVLLAVSSIICFVIGYCTSGVPFFKICSFNATLSSIIYIFIGYMLKSYIDRIETIKPIHGTICICIYAVLCVAGCIILPNATLDFHNVKYGNIPLNIIMILAGIAASITLGVVLCRRFKLTALCILGHNTLVTYLLSPYIISAINKIFLFFHINTLQTAKESVLVALILALAVCGICAFISEICGHFFPWSIGLRYSRNEQMKPAAKDFECETTKL